MHKTRLDPKDLPPVEAATLRRILVYVRPYWRRALVVTACMTAAAALSLSLPWFVRRVVDEAIPQGNIRLLWLYCAAMIAGPALAGLLEVVQKYSSEVIGQQVMIDLRVALYRQLHAMPFAFFASVTANVAEEMIARKDGRFSGGNSVPMIATGSRLRW